MEDHTVKRLALVLSVQAEIEAMKFDNLVRLEERLALAYTTEDFECKAEELRILASKHPDNL